MDAGRELWRYDGSIVEQAAGINPGTGWASPNWLTAYSGDLYFSANDGGSGYELWKYDGSAAERITDLRPGSASSYPEYLTVLGDTPDSLASCAWVMFRESRMLSSRLQRAASICSLEATIKSIL